MLDIVFFNVNNANAIIVVKANKAISNYGIEVRWCKKHCYLVSTLSEN